MKEAHFKHKDQLLVSTSTKCWYSNLKWKLQCCFQNVHGEWHAQLAQAPVMDALLVYQLANQPCPGPLSIGNWDPHAKLMVWRGLRWFVPWTSNQKHYVRRNIVNVCVYMQPKCHWYHPLENANTKHFVPSYLHVKWSVIITMVNWTGKCLQEIHCICIFLKNKN